MIGPAHPNYNGDRMIIGISGYARAGKDTIGDILVEKYGFTKFAFADKLRETLYTLNPLVGVDGEPFSGELIYIGVKDVIDRYGWGGYKETVYGAEIRRLLQRMGTEVGREMIADDIWVREIDKTSGRIVVTDMRFPNEVHRIKDNGGHTWRVDRAGTNPVNPHPSEVAIDDYNFDVRINNSGDLERLEKKVRHWMEERYRLSPSVL